MISGIDVGTSQRNLDFGLAFRSGYRACYVKLGGDNVGRYTAPHYTAQIDKAHAAGFPYIGSYWVTGGYDPAGSADYYWANVRGSSFHVLDNEDLDSGRMWTDAECATFFHRLIAHGVPRSSLFLYLGASAMRGQTWPQCEALLGDRVIVASYGANDGTYPGAPNMGGRFGNTWAGHQYTSNGNIGGVGIDLNVFQDWAFDNVSAAGGGITLIMSFSDQASVRDPNNPGQVIGKTSFGGSIEYAEAYGKRLWQWVTRKVWGRTPEQNERYVTATVEAIAKYLGIRPPVADKDYTLPATMPTPGTLAEVLALGQRVSLELSDADTDLLAEKIAAKMPAAATPDAMREIVQSELAALVLAPRA